MLKKLCFFTLALFFASAVYFSSLELVFNHNNKYVPDINGQEPLYEMTIFSRAYGPPVIWRFLGHSWIYIYNKSGDDIYISGLKVSPGDGITMGTSAMPTLEHRGIWYNLEESGSETYGKNVALSMPIYESDIEYINRYLENHDRWGVFYNCTNFATDIWNNTSAGYYDKLMRGMPIIVEKDIKRRDGYIIDGTFETSLDPSY